MTSRIVRLILILTILKQCYAFGSSGKKGGCVFANLGRGGSLSRLQTTTRRHLLQEGCGGPLDLGNGPISLASCTDLTSDLGSELIFHWTVVEDGNGNSTVRGAIDAPYTEGSVDWAGVGFEQDLEMIGGNAFIVRASDSGATVDDYYLAATNTQGVQPPSQLSVTSKTAALVDGRLLAVFDFSLPITGNALDTVGLIYAVGPLTPDGDLEQHTYYSAQQLDMAPGVAESLGPALAPAASEPPVSGEAPPPATPPTAGAEPPSGTGGGLASAPSASGGCTLEFAGNNSMLSFSQCQSLATEGTANNGFRLLWNLLPSPSGNGSLMQGAIESGNPSYWAGYGIPSSPGAMIGANAIIVKPCADCPTGASADNYALNGYQSSDVQAGTGNLEVQSLEAASSPEGSIQAVFTLLLPQSTDELDSPQDIIASVGPVSSSEELQSHPISYAYTGQVNLASGSLSGSVSTGQSDRKTKVHALLMIIGWGLLLPLGTVFARCKEWGPVWFQLHRACQAVAYLAGVAGAGVGLALGRPNMTKLETDHRIIGLTVFILLTIQVSAIIWRPAPHATKIRYTWNSLHWVLGGGAIFLAFANVIIGLHIAGQPAKWPGLYALGFGLILILWIAKLAFNLMFVRRKTPAEGRYGNANGQALAPNKHSAAQNGGANGYQGNKASGIAGV